VARWSLVHCMCGGGGSPSVIFGSTWARSEIMSVSRRGWPRGYGSGVVRDFWTGAVRSWVVSLVPMPSISGSFGFGVANVEEV
jgi:hypothetical protein